MSSGTRVHHRIGGIVKIGKSVLFIRYLDNDGLPKAAFHVPSIAYEENRQKEHLQNAFMVNFGAEVKVFRHLLPIKRGKDSLLVFYCEEATPVRFPVDSIEARYFKMEELRTVAVAPLDYLAARKAMAFLPYLKSTKRQVPLTPEEHDKIATMFDAFDFFKDMIPNSEAKQFYKLVNSNTPYELLFEAFRIILEQYGCNYYEYSDFLAHNGKRKVRP